MNNKLNYTFRVVRNGKTVDRCQTHLRRRFSARLRTINWQITPLKVYLRVSYGRQKCNLGCVCNFANEGEYESKTDLLGAFAAFTEK